MKNLLALYFLLQCYYCSGQVGLLSGTLVLVTPSKSGLVVVVDRRFMNVNGNDTSFHEDTKTKKLNNYFGYVVAGIREQRDSFIDMRPFNAITTIDQFFIDQEVIIDKNTMNDLGEFLKKAYDESRYNSYQPYEGLVCELFIYGYDVKSHLYKMCYMALKFFKQAEAEYTLFPSSFFLHSICTSIGETSIIKELKSSNQKILKGVTRKRTYNLVNGKAKGLCRLNEVIRFSQFAIIETSKKHQSVGEIVDITLVNPKGYNFIERK